MAFKRPIIYTLEIETRSPLHIGVGRILRRDYDYAVHAGNTWVINQRVLSEEILEAGQDDSGWQHLLQGSPAAELLVAEDFQAEGPLFRYVLKGQAHSQASGSEIQELLKDGWDHAYLPGSSLKGALRTAFLVDVFGKLKMHFDPEEMGRSAKYAAQPIEQKIAAPQSLQERRGRAPNYDIFRALQVSDSQPGEPQTLMVANVAVFAGSQSKIPIALECVPKGTVFQATLTLDSALLDRFGSTQLGWDAEKQAKWLRRIDVAARRFALRRLRQEYQYWKGKSAAMELFHGLLFKEMDEAPAGTFFIQVGWGGGWSSKTLGHHLTGDVEAFAKLMKRFGRQMDRTGSFQPGKTYPNSRRALISDGAATAPLGWLKIDMERAQ